MFITNTTYEKSKATFLFVDELLPSKIFITEKNVVSKYISM